VSHPGFDIVRLYLERGVSRSDEAVSHLAHALQCAALASAQRADDDVVLAALLHDVGHLISLAEESPRNHHGAWGARLLRPFVPRRVAWLVEHHVIAKRYLCTVDPDYVETLSPVSVRSWIAQGGPLDAALLSEMERAPGLADALRIRQWDDSAKDPRAVVPPLSAYRNLIDPCFGAQCWEMEPRGDGPPLRTAG
jgi:predicted HD phosphohydrolase